MRPPFDFDVSRRRELPRLPGLCVSELPTAGPKGRKNLAGPVRAR